MAKSEFITVDGNKGGYQWQRHKKKNAIEIMVEYNGNVSHVLINAERKEISFAGDLNFFVNKITTNKNGYVTEKLLTEEQFAKLMAKKL
jgi:hypothetical protein